MEDQNQLKKRLIADAFLSGLTKQPSIPTSPAKEIMQETESSKQTLKGISFQMSHMKAYGKSNPISS